MTRSSPLPGAYPSLPCENAAAMVGAMIPEVRSCPKSCSLQSKPLGAAAPTMIPDSRACMDTARGSHERARSQPPRRANRVAVADRLDFVRIRLPGVDVRRHGSYDFHARGVSERQRPDRLEGSRIGGLCRRTDLRRKTPGLGSGGHRLRRRRRSHRTCEDDDDHRPDLFGLHRLERLGAELVAAPDLSSLGRNRHRRRMGRGCCAGPETWPERTRQRALVAMQMSFAGGFFLAGLLNVLVGPIGWRWVFAAGAVPALLALFIRRLVPEPERWIAVRRRGQGSSRERAATTATFLAIFAPDVRARTAVGVAIAAAMMIGAWGTSTLLPIWIHQLVGPEGAAVAVRATGQCFMLANVGAVFGYLAVMWLNDAMGRRWSYFLVVVGCIATRLFAFTQIATIQALVWFMPLYGFFA